MSQDDSHKCNICLDDVQFPMSNGCCSFKFCKTCYDLMPREQKLICSGCRTPTQTLVNSIDEFLAIGKQLGFCLTSSQAENGETFIYLTRKYD